MSCRLPALIILKVGDNNIGKDVCPTGWYEVPDVELKSLRPTRGWNDYKRWYLASDAHARKTLQAMGITDPVLPGSTFYFDWRNGIHKYLLRMSFDNCPGIRAAPHQCNNSVVAAKLGLKMPYPSAPPAEDFNVATPQTIERDPRRPCPDAPPGAIRSTRGASGEPRAPRVSGLTGD